MRETGPIVMGIVAGIMGLMVLSPRPLHAASIVCPNNIGYGAPISDNVTPSTGCEIGSINNDKLNPLQVNVDAMFGFTDWQFAEKVLEGLEQTVDVGLEAAGGVISGTWSIDDIWTTLGVTDFMLVLKGPASHQSTPNTYVGYLIQFGATDGDYLTPFANHRGNPQGISHISAYYRVGTHNQVPEPQLLVMLGVGLLFGARRVARVRRTS